MLAVDAYQTTGAACPPHFEVSSSRRQYRKTTFDESSKSEYIALKSAIRLSSWKVFRVEKSLASAMMGVLSEEELEEEEVDCKPCSTARSRMLKEMNFVSSCWASSKADRISAAFISRLTDSPPPLRHCSTCRRSPSGSRSAE
ncbi:hypothetical protein TYRP_002092 [Tyrophagus putrescentiae]|nr:hypothetical protein TYRP_002092 [Tyrophagus putrescentiae]